MAKKKTPKKKIKPEAHLTLNLDGRALELSEMEAVLAFSLLKSIYGLKTPKFIPIPSSNIPTGNIPLMPLPYDPRS